MGFSRGYDVKIVDANVNAIESDPDARTPGAGILVRVHIGSGDHLPTKFMSMLNSEQKNNETYADNQDHP